MFKFKRWKRENNHVEVSFHIPFFIFLHSEQWYLTSPLSSSLCEQTKRQISCNDHSKSQYHPHHQGCKKVIMCLKFCHYTQNKIWFIAKSKLDHFTYKVSSLRVSATSCVQNPAHALQLQKALQTNCNSVIIYVCVLRRWEQVTHAHTHSLLVMPFSWFIS